MDRIKKLLESLYLGDRFCEKMEIIEDKIIFQINLISRLEEGSTEWNYYSGKNIEQGCLVFEGVVEFHTNSELEFNDEIYSVDVVGKDEELYSFVVSGCNVSDECISTGIEYQIKAKTFYIYNPQDDSILTN